MALTDLQELAKKLKIDLKKKREVVLDYGGGSVNAYEWYKALEKLFAETGETYASAEVEMAQYDDYVDSIHVWVMVPKTEDDLKADIKAAEVQVAKLKKAEDAKEAKERKEYERLKAKFG